MAVSSIFNSGVEAFNKAQDMAMQSASAIASNTTQPRVDSAQSSGQPPVGGAQSVTVENAMQQDMPVTDAVVQLRQSELQAQSAAGVIKTADDVVGSLLDVHA